MRIYVFAGGHRPELPGTCPCAMPMFGRSACRGGLACEYALLAAQHDDETGTVSGERLRMESWAKETVLQTRTNGTRRGDGRGGQVGDKPKQRQRQARPGEDAKRRYNRREESITHQSRCC